jgi:hypothetical protein
MPRLHAAALVLGAALLGCGGERAAPGADSAPAAAADGVPAAPPEDLTIADTTLAPALATKLGVAPGAMTRRPSGLYVHDRRRGAGAAADRGRWITVNYTGWLTDGTVIDDTRKGGEPRDVLLGFGKVIPAWEEGLRGMKAGGRRLLVVPPALGYGAAGQPGTVPSRATLVFDVEVTRVH